MDDIAALNTAAPAAVPRTSNDRPSTPREPIPLRTARRAVNRVAGMVMPSGACRVRRPPGPTYGEPREPS